MKVFFSNIPILYYLNIYKNINHQQMNVKTIYYNIRIYYLSLV